MRPHLGVEENLILHNTELQRDWSEISEFSQKRKWQLGDLMQGEATVYQMGSKPASGACLAMKPQAASHLISVSFSFLMYNMG